MFWEVKLHNICRQETRAMSVVARYDGTTSSKAEERNKRGLQNETPSFPSMYVRMYVCMYISVVPQYDRTTSSSAEERNKRGLKTKTPSLNYVNGNFKIETNSSSTTGAKKIGPNSKHFHIK